MKVIIEAQSMSAANFRGIPYYTANLIEQLVMQNNNKVGITFLTIRENDITEK